MPVAPNIVEDLLRSAFPDDEIIVEDQRGNGDYYAISIVSDAFAGLNRVQQHKLVHKALSSVVNDIHALSLRTKTKS